MKKHELLKEWIEKNGDKIKEAYSSASARNIDISSKEEVLKLLQIIDPQNADESNAEVLSKILQLFQMNLNKKFRMNSQKKNKIIH
jgi:hypothetical protein